jgi:hypothetical protein
MKNSFLSKNNILELEKLLLRFVNQKFSGLCLLNFDNESRLESYIFDLIEDSFESLVSDESLIFQTKFTRRGMADLAFSDKDGVNYIIDVKTHNLGTDFSMPNLTANRGLVKLYETESEIPENYFMVLVFSYRTHLISFT